MMNQRVIRPGRLRCFSPTGWPAILASVTMFMSCTCCGYLPSRIRRKFAIPMGGNGGFLQSDAAENEIAKLALEIGGIAVGQARNRRQPSKRGHQHGVVRKPEQVQRLSSIAGCIARLYRSLQRCGEHGSDQSADLLVDQACTFP